MSEQTHEVKSSPPERRLTVPLKSLGLIALVVILCALSFVGGRQYQKHHGGSAAATSNRGSFGGRFGGMRRDGAIGSVTAVSSSSVTVNDQRSGSSKTYSIGGSTQITDNGSTVDYTDIKTGDTVLVTTDSSSSSTATRIVVNPSFGGGMGQGGAPAQSDTQSQ